MSVKIRARASVRRRREYHKSLPASRVLRILPGMPTNPLMVLRLALPGQPSMREVARKLGCSQTLLNKFERGEIKIGQELLEKYAKVVGRTPADVMERWLHAALELNRQRRLELQADLRALGVKDPRLRRGRKSA